MMNRQSAGKRMKMKKIIIAIGAAALIIAGICGTALYRYVSNVPKVTPKQSVFDVESGRSYSLEELADVRCKGGYSGEMRILDTNISDAEIKKDSKDTLYAGSEAGYIHLAASGRGDHSEYGEETEFYVFTALSQAQQEDLAKKLSALFEQVDGNIRKEHLKDENAEVQYAAVTVCLSDYNADGKNMSPTFYSEYKLSDGGTQKLVTGTSAVTNGDKITLEGCESKTDTPMSDGLCTVDVMRNVFDNCDKQAADNSIVQDYTWKKLGYGLYAVFSPESYRENGLADMDSALYHIISYAADVTGAVSDDK